MKSTISCPQLLIGNEDTLKAFMNDKAIRPPNKIQNKQQTIIKYSKQAGKSKNIEKINMLFFEEQNTSVYEFIEKTKQIKNLLAKYHDIEFQISPKTKLRYCQETDSQQTFASEKQNFRFQAKSKLTNLLANSSYMNSQYSSMAEELGLYIIEMQLARRKDSYAFAKAIQKLINENSSIKKTAVMINYFEEIFQFQEIRLKPHNYMKFCEKHFQFFENDLKQAYAQEYFEKANIFQKLFKFTFSKIQTALKVPSFESLQRQVFKFFCCILGSKQFLVRQICTLPFVIVILSAASLQKQQQLTIKETTKIASNFLKVKPRFLNGVIQKVCKRFLEMKEQYQIKDQLTNQINEQMQ